MLGFLSEKRHVVTTLKVCNFVCLFVCLFVQFKSCAFPKMNVRVQVGRVLELESTEMILKACNDSSTLQETSRELHFMSLVGKATLKKHPRSTYPEN